MAQEADLAAALQEKDSTARLGMVEKLVQDGSDGAVETLAAALFSSNWPVCDELADALARIGTEHARSALVKALKARRHHIRSAAIRALVKTGDTRVAKEIAKLGDDPSYEVREDARRAVSELRATEPAAAGSTSEKHMPGRAETHGTAHRQDPRHH